MEPNERLEEGLNEELNERTSLISKGLPTHSVKHYSLISFVWFSLFLLLLVTFNPFKSTSSNSPDFNHLNYQKQCPGLKPIGLDEFEARRITLSNLLIKNNNDNFNIYITEPSINSLYYTNVSTEWSLSERPFLFAFSPSVTSESNSQQQINSHLSILSPSFEVSRGKGLPLALTDEEFNEVDWVAWKEEENPYEIMLKHLVTLSQNNSLIRYTTLTIQIEENARQFISNGLEQAIKSLEIQSSTSIEFASLEIREQRMRKSEAELQIQRCASKITLDSLRAVRPLLYIGMTEKEGESLISKALTAAGLSDLGIICLFGANAALPHASASESKRLELNEFILMDVDGSLFGYQSDITRTMLPNNKNGEKLWPNERAKRIWETVKLAQLAALESLSIKDVRAKEVDKSARDVITKEGWGIYFSHRLGHGLSLQVHEAPYLNSGNENVLPIGTIVTIEPGIYIEKPIDTEGSGIGVRLEDDVYKTENGYELISGYSLANSPWEP